MPARWQKRVRAKSQHKGGKENEGNSKIRRQEQRLPSLASGWDAGKCDLLRGMAKKEKGDMIKRQCPRCKTNWYSAYTKPWRCKTCGKRLNSKHDKPLREEGRHESKREY